VGETLSRQLLAPRPVTPKTSPTATPRVELAYLLVAGCAWVSGGCGRRIFVKRKLTNTHTESLPSAAAGGGGSPHGYILRHQSTALGLRLVLASSTSQRRRRLTNFWSAVLFHHLLQSTTFCELWGVVSSPLCFLACTQEQQQQQWLRL